MRLTIQSWSTPIAGLISALGTTRSGSALPSPTMPALERGGRRRGVRRGVRALAPSCSSSAIARAPFDVARDELREHLVGSDVDELLDAGRGDRSHRLAPAHRPGQRAGELRADVAEGRGGEARRTP